MVEAVWEDELDDGLGDRCFRTANRRSGLDRIAPLRLVIGTDLRRVGLTRQLVTRRHRHPHPASRRTPWTAQPEPRHAVHERPPRKLHPPCGLRHVPSAPVKRCLDLSTLVSRTFARTPEKPASPTGARGAPGEAPSRLHSALHGSPGSSGSGRFPAAGALEESRASLREDSSADGRAARRPSGRPAPRWGHIGRPAHQLRDHDPVLRKRATSPRQAQTTRMDGSSAPTRMLGAPARAGSPGGAGEASLRWPAPRPRPIGPSRNEPPGARRTGPRAPRRARTRRAKLSRPTPSPPMSASAGRDQCSANARSRVMQGSLQTSSGGSRISSPSSRSTAMDHSSSPVPPCLGYDEAPSAPFPHPPRPDPRRTGADLRPRLRRPGRAPPDRSARRSRRCAERRMVARTPRARSQESPGRRRRTGRAESRRRSALPQPPPPPASATPSDPGAAAAVRSTRGPGARGTHLGIAHDVARMERRRAVDLDIVHRDARSACPELHALALDQDLGTGGKAVVPAPSCSGYELSGLTASSTQLLPGAGAGRMRGGRRRATGADRTGRNPLRDSRHPVQAARPCGSRSSSCSEAVPRCPPFSPGRLGHPR